MRLSIFGPALAVAAALALSACATDGQVITVPSGPVAPPSGATAISAVAQKALYTAEASYNVAGQAYVSADGAGLLTPELKARLKPMFATAYQALLATRHAATIGDSIGVLAAADTAQKQASAAAAAIPTPSAPH